SFRFTVTLWLLVNAPAFDLGFHLHGTLLFHSGSPTVHPRAPYSPANHRRFVGRRGERALVAQKVPKVRQHAPCRTHRGHVRARLGMTIAIAATDAWLAARTCAPARTARVYMPEIT